MRIGVLTGGGDVPGLNASIKAVVRRVAEDGHNTVGIRRGWAGLLECQPEDPASVAACLVPLDPGVGADDRPLRRHRAPQLPHQPGPGEGVRGARRT